MIHVKITLSLLARNRGIVRFLGRKDIPTSSVVQRSYYYLAYDGESLTNPHFSESGIAYWVSSLSTCDGIVK